MRPVARVGGRSAAVRCQVVPNARLCVWGPADENEAQIAKLGGLKPIIRAAGVSTNKELQSQSARALRNLSVNGESHAASPCPAPLPRMCVTRHGGARER